MPAAHATGAPPPALKPQPPEPFDDGSETASFPVIAPEQPTTKVTFLTPDSGAEMAFMLERLGCEVAQMRQEIGFEVETAIKRAAAPLAAALAPLLSSDTHHEATRVKTQTPEMILQLPPVGFRRPWSEQSTTDQEVPERLPAFCSSGAAGGLAAVGAITVSSEAKFYDGTHSVGSEGLASTCSRKSKTTSVGLGCNVKKAPTVCTPMGGGPRMFRAAINDDVEEVNDSSTRGLDDIMPDDAMMRTLTRRQGLVVDNKVMSIPAMHRRRSNTLLSRALALGPEPPRTSWLAQIIHGSRYQKFVAIVILLNILFVGYSQDYAVLHHGYTSNLILGIEVVFLAFFSLEASINSAVSGIWFFVGRQWKWNMLELIIIVISAANVAAGLVRSNQRRSDLIRADQLRLLRILQATTILRAFRGFKVLHDLRILLRSIHCSLRSLGWSLVMLTIIFYIFSIFFVGAAVEMHERDDGDEMVDPETQRKIMERFGSTQAALVSLFTASLGGVDWDDFARPLKKAGIFYYVAFLVFIGFVLLAALNILTALFVERAAFADKNDYRGITEMEEKRERGLVKEFTRVYYAILMRSGKLTATTATAAEQSESQQTLGIIQEEFEDYVERVPGARHLFAVLGLKIWDPAFFFSLLCRNCVDGQVDVETFVDVCMQLRGPATCFDLQCLLELLEAQASAALVSRPQTRQPTARSDNLM